jgi:hypothetical protein
MSDEMRIVRARRPTSCLTCRRPIGRLLKVKWVKGVGCWHFLCPDPPNLDLYIRERDNARARSLSQARTP